MSEISLNFARTMNDLDDRMPKGRGDCFDFGQWFGCRTDCPVFLNGKCSEASEMVENIKNDLDLTCEDLEKLKQLYQNIKEIQLISFENK